MRPRNKTVLLVDDERSPRTRMRQALVANGYDVIEAGDYPEACAVLERRSDEIDMLLADVSIPGNNSCELAKSALALNPRIKVLLISGHTGAEICKFYGIPATDVHFLEKPFRAVDLLARVRYVFESCEPLGGVATGGASA